MKPIIGVTGAAARSRSPASGPLSEIRHQFRVAEPRPARAVSDVFALLCCAPLLLLLLLWARLRVNLSHFPFTPSALLFHLALGGDFSSKSYLKKEFNFFSYE